jgi:hypothetical protein
MDRLFVCADSAGWTEAVGTQVVLESDSECVLALTLLEYHMVKRSGISCNFQT